MRAELYLLGMFVMTAGLAASCATPPSAPNTPLVPSVAAAGGDELALRATPDSESVGDVYHWVHTHDFEDIEARLRREIPGHTQRLYSPDKGVRIKYMDAEAVYLWEARSGQMKRGRWSMGETEFGPQICETFYGAEECLNTVELLSGVGRIDMRAGDVFGLISGSRPRVERNGVPDWP